MNWQIVFHGEFFVDAERARDWYELEQSGLGYRFVERLHEIVESVAKSPESYTKADRVTRVAIIKPFPYGVYFRVEDDLVVFLAILQLRRKPGLWHKRHS